MDVGKLLMLPFVMFVLAVLTMTSFLPFTNESLLFVWVVLAALESRESGCFYAAVRFPPAVPSQMYSTKR